MKITQNVREYAQNQNTEINSDQSSQEIETGLKAMSDVYLEQGQKLYHKV